MRKLGSLSIKYKNELKKYQTDFFSLLLIEWVANAIHERETGGDDES